MSYIWNKKSDFFTTYFNRFLWMHDSEQHWGGTSRCCEQQEAGGPITMSWTSSVPQSNSPWWQQAQQLNGKPTETSKMWMFCRTTHPVSATMTWRAVARSVWQDSRHCKELQCVMYLWSATGWMHVSRQMHILKPPHSRRDDVRTWGLSEVLRFRWGHEEGPHDGTSAGEGAKRPRCAM